MPIKGAVITAALIDVPRGSPTTGKSFQTEKTTYTAAKQAVKAVFLADENCDFEIMGILRKDLFFRCQPSSKETIS